ncbi:MAG: hypothetical protein RLZZ232_1710 [Planctomycetota bacterium]
MEVRSRKKPSIHRGDVPSQTRLKELRELREGAAHAKPQTSFFGSGGTSPSQTNRKPTIFFCVFRVFRGFKKRQQHLANDTTLCPDLSGTVAAQGIQNADRVEQRPHEKIATDR